MRARSYPLFCGALATTLLFAGASFADELKPAQDAAGVITSISQGVKEISPESIFVLGFDKRGDVDDFRMTLLFGGTFRYFILKNAALGFNLSFLYKTTDGQAVSSDLGGLLNINIGYYASLGGGMFFKPLIGLGGFYARHSQDMLLVAGGRPTSVAASSFGGVLRPGFNFVFYSSPRFNMFAGPEVLISLGGTSTEQVAGQQIDGQFFVTIDGGFNFGVSYVF